MTELAPTGVLEVVKFPATRTANDLAAFAADTATLTDDKTMGAVDGIPDVILVATFPDLSAAAAKALKQAGNTIPITITNRAQKVLDAIGADANGLEGAAPVLAESNASGQSFLSRYKAANSRDAETLDAQAYDAATTLMLAALIASKDLSDPSAVTGAQVRDALRKTSVVSAMKVGTGDEEFGKAVKAIAAGTGIDYDGAGGPCDFDDQGNSKMRISYFTVANAHFNDLDTYDCVASPMCPKL